MATCMSIIIAAVDCRVLIGIDEHLLLFKSVSSLLGVQPRSLVKRLDREGLATLTQYAFKEAMAALQSAGAISSKERYTRVFTIDALRRLAPLRHQDEASQISTLICETVDLARETATSNFLAHASQAPESPKDKAKRVAAMPGLHEKVALCSRRDIDCKPRTGPRLPWIKCS